MSSNLGESQSAVVTLIDKLRLLLPPLLCSQRSSWEQGIAAQALLECHIFLEAEHVSVPDFLGSGLHGLIPWLYALAHDALVRQAPDGRLAVLLNCEGKSDTGALDPACIGPTLYYLCAVERGHRVPVVDVHEPSSPLKFPAPRQSATLSRSILDGVEDMLYYILEDCPRAFVRMPHRPEDVWSDSVYMLPPFLVSAAAFYFREPSQSVTLTLKTGRCGSQTYTAYELLRMDLQQIVLASEVLQGHTAGEWSHIFDLRAANLARTAFWGVGNGWVCCGIIRVLLTTVEIDSLRVGESAEDGSGGERGEIVALLHCVHDILLKTVRACLAHMLPSCLFPDKLDDPTSFEETNLAQMLSCTLFRLIDLHQHSPAFHTMGFAPLAEEELVHWKESADNMRRAAEAKTDRWGFVRDVCGSPRFDAPGTAAEGQAWAIMMEVARAQYLRHACAEPS